MAGFLSFKFTREERNWVGYDVGNSALVMLNTSVVPIYFNSLLKGGDSDRLVVLWGLAQTIASLVVAILMPLLGSLADRRDMKIKFFLGFFLTGLVGCIALALPMGATPFLVVFVICTIGLNSSMTFYDAMLTDVTTDERMDNVSSAGFAWGYIGSCVPFILSLVLIFAGPSTGLVDTATATRLSFVITAAWWLAFTIPLIKSYKQTHWREARETGVAATFHELGVTMREIGQNKIILTYMLAFFFYIDGVHTVIAMATSYGTALGIDSTQLVLALLITQFVAFPSAIAYGMLAGRYGTLKMIRIAVLAYCGIVLFAAFFLKTAFEFWILAITVGLFQGGVQALSRSYFGKIIPKEKSNEYYGFFDIFGRYASVMGTAIVAGVTAATGSSSIGVLSVGLLLVVGWLMLRKLPNE
ncbi:MFS transporter [Atopobium sp. oral taxon 810]|uniref:MFS transporter n=1 Tax=Atopobium sp. oral taxon 810 TaxID=712158 RepID=UPI0003962032|nr:MFS transporter [Atopobium sp. oral taxon 810]ERI06126.1 transporter, major facilitator family protein [Atopobium sp. oral taxon 810 str. F0209]